MCGSTGAGNGTLFGLGRLAQVGEHPRKNKSSWAHYTAGAGVAPLGDDLLRFLACSLTLDLASTIEDEEIVDFERVKHAVVADF